MIQQLRLVPASPSRRRLEPTLSMLPQPVGLDLLPGSRRHCRCPRRGLRRHGQPGSDRVVQGRSEAAQSPHPPRSHHGGGSLPPQPQTIGAALALDQGEQSPAFRVHAGGNFRCCNPPRSWEELCRIVPILANCDRKVVQKATFNKLNNKRLTATNTSETWWWRRPELQQ